MRISASNGWANELVGKPGRVSTGRRSAPDIAVMSHEPEPLAIHGAHQVVELGFLLLVILCISNQPKLERPSFPLVARQQFRQ